MPKRLTDTEIWDKRWFRMLTPAEKCALSYIKDRCDLAGVWCPDFELAEVFIGEKIDWQALPEKLNNNVQILDNGKWWLPDFVAFQCGCLPEEETANRAHRGYVAQLKKHGLYDGSLIGNIRVIDGHKDNEQDKDNDKTKKKTAYADSVLLSEPEWEKLVAKFGEPVARQLVDTLSSAKQAKGYKYKSDYHAILTWVVEKCKAVPVATRELIRAGPGWPCPHCGYVNRQTGSVCFKCHKDRDDDTTSGE